jgi:Fe-Mn family superoxide dismutase
MIMKKVFLTTLLLAGTLVSVLAQHNLPALPYAYDALEPYIDKQTMEIHHDKHHAAYINNLNAAIKGTDLEKIALEELIKNISKYTPAVRNNAGGHWNHTMFWEVLVSHDKSGTPNEKLMAAFTKEFGSFEKFKELFNEAGTKRFGSGWVWLIVKDGKLVITSTANQDNPLMDVSEVKGTPILCLDVWEHAYYLKYQNKRVDYIKAFWDVINWAEVSKRFEASLK